MRSRQKKAKIIRELHKIELVRFRIMTFLQPPLLRDSSMGNYADIPESTVMPSSLSFTAMCWTLLGMQFHYHYHTN